MLSKSRLEIKSLVAENPRVRGSYMRGPRLCSLKAEYLEQIKRERIR